MGFLLTNLLVSALTLTSTVISQSPIKRPALPEGCLSNTFPDHVECAAKNYFLGDAVDKCASPGPIPIPGEQVYLKDPVNFCIMLPDPNNFRKLPRIIDGEGYAQVFCTGDHVAPGSLPLAPGSVTSAHVITNLSKGGKKYIQMAGTFDCTRAGINCTASAPGAYDDGGQYDSVRFVNCGKEPYSGVSAEQGPGMVEFVMQAGNGIFCMRICEKGTETPDPCNVKDDTKGCEFTMGITTFNTPGFTLTDGASGEKKTFNVDLPPPTATTAGTGGSGGTASGSTPTGATGTGSNPKTNSATSMAKLYGASVVLAFFLTVF